MSEDKIVQLSEIEDSGEIELGRGNVISTGDLSADPGNYPVYSSSAVGSGEFGRYGKYMFDEPLITWSVDGGGRPFLRKKHRFSVTNVCGYLRIIDPKKWDYGYLHAAILKAYEKIQFDYQAKAHPSVIRDLYHLRWVPINQQRLIAQILDTLDTQIQKTEALIAKLEKVKEGLLHDLLTRGIDESGQLRPSSEEAPELYKESPLGLIPREWEARPLSTAVKKLIPGAAIKSGEFSDTGRPIIAKSDVTGSKLIDIENREQFVSLQAANLYSRSMIDKGAVVVSLRDLVPSGPTVGMGSIFYGEGVYILAQGTYGLYLKEDLMTREFFSEITRRSYFRSQARGITVGSTQVHARSSEYIGIIIPIPTLHEQIAINERIRSLDETISAENRVLSEATDLKKGLMNDLLTGRVRVTPLLEQAQATTPA